MSSRTERVALLGILLLATALRLVGLSWGLPHAYHPDEGSILAHALGFGTGDLNPHWFRWPSLQMYIMFAVYGLYFVFGRITGLFQNPQDLMAQYIQDVTPFWYLGRLFSALAGVVTVYVVYRLARRLFGPGAGLISAALLAVTYLHVRDSHYATPDVFMTLLMVVSFGFATRIPEQPTLRNHAAAGLFAGLAVSTKYLGGVLVCVPILFADLLAVARRKVGLAHGVGLLAVAATVSLAGFVLGTPYSVLDFPKFSEHFFVQSDMMSLEGASAPSPSEGPLPGLAMVFARILPNGMGWPLYLIGSFGLLGSLWWWRGRGLLLLSYVLPYLVVFCILPIKRATYFTPLLPAFAIGGALGLLWIRDRMRRDSAPAWAQVLVPGVLLAVMMGVTMTDCWRFDRILTRPDTRSLAQRWVEANLPEYSTVVTDQYGPVLNLSQRQLMGITGADTTAVRSWASHKSRLNTLRYELLKDRRPQFEVVELPAVRAALAYPGVEAALRQHPEAGYLVLSSKHVGCPEDLVTCVRGALPTDEWHLEPLRSIAAEDDVPALDNPGALTFHNPSIVVFQVSPLSPAAVPTPAP